MLHIVLEHVYANVDIRRSKSLGERKKEIVEHIMQV